LRSNFEYCGISQPSARPVRIVYSTAVRLITGNIPGIPRQIEQTRVLGSASK
jgi:hypothetical protein